MRSDDIETVKLAVEDIVGPSWVQIIALLEQVTDEGAFTLRLGFIEQAQRVLDEMGQPDAKPELVNRLRHITEVLAHLPWS